MLFLSHTNNINDEIDDLQKSEFITVMIYMIFRKKNQDNILIKVLLSTFLGE